MQSRRDVLRTGGAAIVAATFGATPSGADGHGRWILDVRGASGSLDDADVEILAELGSDDVAVVEGPESEAAKVSSGYARDLSADLTEPVPEGAADEASYPYQWDKQGLSIPTAHDRTRGEGSRVVVLDSGIQTDHEDLAGPLNEELSTTTYPGDDSGDFSEVGYHGTAVSGVVAADDTNGQGITGIAPGTDLVAVRITPPDGGGSAPFSAILAGFDYAASIDADAVNVSYGGFADLSDPGTAEFYATVLGRVTRRVYRQGTLPVASAGNDARDTDRAKPEFHLPSGAHHVVSVSATGPVGFDPETGTVEEPYYRPSYSYSNYGFTGVDVAAPGGTTWDEVDGASYLDGLLTTVPTSLFPSGYAFGTGTSFAAPQVAGAAALLASEYDGPNQARVVDRALTGSAELPFATSPYFDDLEYYGGRGYLDILGALDRV